MGTLLRDTKKHRCPECGSKLRLAAATHEWIAWCVNPECEREQVWPPKVEKMRRLTEQWTKAWAEAFRRASEFGETLRKVAEEQHERGQQGGDADEGVEHGKERD